jgi:hypothetical protein
MRIFIDDSGDAGFKIEKGATRFFVIALVIFDDDLEAEKTALEIKKLRRELGFPDEYEFKFQKCRRAVRERFLNAVKPCAFRIRSIVVDKKLIYSEELKNDKSSFYSYVIKMVLKHNQGKIKDAKVRIDGSGDRVFRKKFLGYIQRELNPKGENIVKDCKLLDSKGNVLVQFADMTAGSIRRSYDADKTDREVYKKIIKKHIEDEWLFR